MDQSDLRALIAPPPAPSVTGDELRHKMEPPPEYRGQRPGVLPKIFAPLADFESNLADRAPPLPQGPVVVGEGNPVGRVADPVHEAEEGAGEEAFEQVILHHHGVSCHPSRLA